MRNMGPEGGGGGVGGRPGLMFLLHLRSVCKLYLRCRTPSASRMMHAEEESNVSKVGFKSIGIKSESLKNAFTFESHRV